MKAVLRYYMLLAALFLCVFMAIKFSSFLDIEHLGGGTHEKTLQINIAKELDKSMYKIRTTIDQEKVSIDEYMKFYNLDPDIHYPCNGISRPKPEDIKWRKNTYQHLSIKVGNFSETDMYAMKCYFDDRFVFEWGQRHVRCILTVNGRKKISRGTEASEWLRTLRMSYWRLMFWYKGFTEPVGVRCTDQPAAGLSRNVSNTVYYQEIVTCIVPEIGIYPESASITNFEPCAQPKTNFEVVYPEPAENPATREIGVCMACLYGTLGHKSAASFVNWMEGVKLFGVNEVTLNNCSVQFQNESMNRVIQYYKDIGRLTFTQYPTLHESWEMLPEEEYQATEAINKITTDDCVYKNMKRYWFVLIMDIDELPVPTNFDTYQDFLTDYFKRHPNLTLAHSFATRSAYFLTDFEAGNPEYGEHLPFLRLSKRFRPEPLETDGVGVSKSFHNTRNMVGAGQHLTRQTHNGGRNDVINHFMPAEEILIHHVRTSCKYKTYCDTHWNDTYHDETLVKKYGQKLKENVEYVLREIGYEF